MMQRTKGVDIVIPVYNALEDLKLCVESLEKHTDLTLDRVIFINDKSPDPNIMPYLKSIEKPGMIVLENEENLGFSGTINRGLVYSDHDVILLNTDTIVTARWVDKLVACAYSNRAIGTVTPFSNNATLCSIPNFCQENVLPDGFTIDEYAVLIERCSVRKYPRITVAVGFCMLIKQELIELIGLFDQKTFEKGYGEENDYCWRAEQMGYYHVLCDDTYIYHSGSASFVSEQKRQLMEDHAKILLEWYPQQMHGNDVYVRDNPDQDLRDNVEIYVDLHNGKKNVLYLLHSDFRQDAVDNVGGTQLHVKDLTTYLRDEHNIFVAARNGEYLQLTAYVGDKEHTFKFHIGPKADFIPFYVDKIDEVLRNIIHAFEIDMIHVHHIINLSFDIFSIAKELEIPLIASLHDFYYICPTIIMMNQDDVRCNGKNEGCAACLTKRMGLAPQISFMEKWYQVCGTSLSHCDVLIAPSETVKNMYSLQYPELQSKIRLIAHGVDLGEPVVKDFLTGSSDGVKYRVESAFAHDYTIRGWVCHNDYDSKLSDVYVRIKDAEGKYGEYLAEKVFRADLSSELSGSALYSGFSLTIPDAYFETGDLKVQLIVKNKSDVFFTDIFTVNGYKKRQKKNKRIAFIGGLTKHKGSRIICQMMKEAGNEFDWYVFGGIGDEELLKFERDNVHKIGWYKRENIISLLRQNEIDLVCILSICAETFCYTFSEAQCAGIPVLAFDVGAVGERMKQDQTGWLISDEQSATETLSKIRGIFSDHGEYKAVKNRTQKFVHKSISEMCRDTDEVYQQFAKRTDLHDFDPVMIYQAYLNGRFTMGTKEFKELQERVQVLENAVRGYQNSIIVRMFGFIWRTNFPFKRTIRRFGGACYRFLKKILRRA